MVVLSITTQLKDKMDSGTTPLIYNKTLDGVGVVTNGFDFDSQTERNAVSLTKIRNFSFSAGTGGTIVLGGTNNGNGLMLVKDAGGTTRVRVDNAGIVINNGNIIISNTAGGTVVDSAGIVSTVNFPNAYVFSNTPVSTTSTSYTAVSGASLSPFVLNRTANVLVFCSVFGYLKHYYLTGDAMTVQGSSSVDGQVFSVPLQEHTDVLTINFAGSSFSTRFSSDTASIQVISSLSAGTHTLSLNYKADASGTAIIEDFAFGYIVLGN